MKVLLLFLLIFDVAWAIDEKNVEKVDKFQSSVKKGWRSLNENIDSFFATEVYEDEINESYIRFNFAVRNSEGNLLNTEYNLRMQTDFPNASKDTKLIIQKEGDRLSEGASDGGIVNSDLANISQEFSEAFEDTSYSAAGRLKLFLDKRWNLYTDLGFRFDVPLDPFVKVRVRRRFSYSRSQLDLVQKVEYFRIEELQHESVADYSHRINTIYNFKSYNSFSYRRLEGFYRFINSLSVFHRYKPKIFFAYTLSASGESDPVIAYNNYSFMTTTRILMHSDWLYLQLGIGVNLPREHNFAVKPFSVLAYEALF